MSVDIHTDKAGSVPELVGKVAAGGDLLFGITHIITRRIACYKGQTERITSIEDVKADRNSDDLQIEVAVNLGGMLIDSDYLTDAKNYLVKSDDKIEIKGIRAITADDRNANNKKYLDKATHIITLKMDALKQDQDVSIRLQNRLPEWIATSSTDDDTNLSAADFAGTTFGLKYLLQGIYDSYKKLSDGEPYYFELKLKLKR